MPTIEHLRGSALPAGPWAARYSGRAQIRDTIYRPIAAHSGHLILVNSRRRPIS